MRVIEHRSFPLAFTFKTTSSSVTPPLACTPLWSSDAAPCGRLDSGETHKQYTQQRRGVFPSFIRTGVDAGLDGWLVVLLDERVTN